MKTEASGLYQHIKSYEGVIQEKIDICEWKPDPNKYSCDDLCELGNVRDRKQEIWGQILKYASDWEESGKDKKGAAISNLSGVLAKFFTKYSDYLANRKISMKDMAISREYLEPLKWDQIQTYKMRLGKATNIVSKCLDSDQFWTKIKKSHEILRVKYPCNDPPEQELQN